MRGKLKKKIFIFFLLLIIIYNLIYYAAASSAAASSAAASSAAASSAAAHNSNKPFTFTYIYTEDFLNKKEFHTLLTLLEKYNTPLNNSQEINKNLVRYNLIINENHITQLLKKYTPQIRALVQNPKIYLANNFPIEYRKYTHGSYMKKHIDTLIYKIPQYECIFTLSNNTDSFTNLAGKKISAKPNSLMIVRALGVEHEVTKVNKGERKFLKFIFTETDEKVLIY